jgi:hypothetical protein
MINGALISWKVSREEAMRTWLRQDAAEIPSSRAPELIGLRCATWRDLMQLHLAGVRFWGDKGIFHDSAGFGEAPN